MKALIRVLLTFVAITLGCGFGHLLRTSEVPVEAQSPPPCATPDPSQNGQAGAWGANQDVIVNISALDFLAEEMDCIQTAFDNWNANNGPNGNNSGVYFRVVRSINAVATLNGNNQAVSTTQEPSFQIERGATDGVAPAITYPDSDASDGQRTAAVAHIDTRVQDCDALTAFMAHEIGHTMGLGHIPGETTTQPPSGSSVMMGTVCGGGPPPNCDSSTYNTYRGTKGPTPCDNAKSQQVGNYYGSNCNPIEVQSCEANNGAYDRGNCQCIPFDPGGGGGGGGGECDFQAWWVCFEDHAYWYDWPACYCEYTPILIDVSGDGFSLSDRTHGVYFDLNNDGTKELVAWTMRGSDDAWLALDRNGNGMINDQSELFGNSRIATNGFVALAEYDQPSMGGNSDGVIDNSDTVFVRLRLWQDVNHNGISEPGELHTLRELGLKAIDLDYRESRRVDQYGNRFRYRAKVKDSRDAQLGRWAWDVFLVTH